MIAGMAPNRVFFPQAVLDGWIAEDRVDLAGEELLLKDEGRRFKILEAMHVLREVAGGGDSNKLVGKVKTRDQLLSMNAEVLEGSMILGDDAYDVAPGFVAEPIGAFGRDRISTQAGPSPQAENDEQLLAQFLMKSL
jgi:hypothetical protein